MALLAILFGAERLAGAHFGGSPAAALTQWFHPPEGRAEADETRLKGVSRRSILRVLEGMLDPANPLGLRPAERRRAAGDAAWTAEATRALQWHQRRLLALAGRPALEAFQRSLASTRTPAPEWASVRDILVRNLGPAAAGARVAGEMAGPPKGWDPGADPREREAWIQAFGPSLDPWTSRRTRLLALAVALEPAPGRTPEDAARILASSAVLEGLDKDLARRWVLLYRALVAPDPARVAAFPLEEGGPPDMRLDEFGRALEAARARPGR